jgi:hypothetical protein
MTGMNRLDRIAAWLGLAATPCFACLALISAIGGGGNPVCSGSRGIAGVDSMTAMYLVMAVFHLRPWLQCAALQDLAQSRKRAEQPQLPGDAG